MLHTVTPFTDTTEDTSIPTKLLQKKLIEAATSGDKNKVQIILEHTIDLNFQDPITGRTALHMAYFKKHSAIATLLIEKGARKDIYDFGGFLPFDLFINPVHKLESYDFIKANKEREERSPYYRHFIQEANLKLSESKCEESLVFIKTTVEMHRYIEANPSKQKIGFIMESPNVIKMTVNNYHVCPIYFERIGSKEIFVHFDSAEKMFYAIPTKTGVERRIYYSDMMRQHSTGGCFEDAVIVLMKILQSTGMLGFCESNAEDVTKTFSKDVTLSEQKSYARLMEKFSPTGKLLLESQEEVHIFMSLTPRIKFQRQITLLSEEKLEPVRKIFRLTTLPTPLFPHIERFDAMRELRLKFPEKFKQKKPGTETTYMALILKHKNFRNPGATLGSIAGNLKNSHEDFDFGGQKFADQRKKFVDAYVSKQTMVHSLFSQKIPLVNPTEALVVIDKINEFVTGKVSAKR